MEELVKHGTLPIKLDGEYIILSRLDYLGPFTSSTSIIRGDLPLGVNYDIFGGGILPFELRCAEKDTRNIDWISEGKRAAAITKGVAVVLVSKTGILRTSFSRKELTTCDIVIHGIRIPSGTSYDFLYNKLKHPDDWMYCIVSSFMAHNNTTTTVKFQPSGDVPVISSSTVKAKSSSTVKYLTDFILKQTGVPVYLYACGSFIPRDDEIIGDLYNLFGSFGSISFTYSSKLLWN